MDTRGKFMLFSHFLLSSFQLHLGKDQSNAKIVVMVKRISFGLRIFGLLTLLVLSAFIFVSRDQYNKPNEFFIDAVITFVNGSDPEFNSELQKERLKGVKIYFAQTPNRFQDHNDLQLLLRSLERHGKLFRHIYIVVSAQSQVPQWLNLSHPKLKIVYHSRIWRNSTQLPVFNSYAVEANLHHIRGLSNVFVYFNDDFLVTNDLKIEDFVLRDKKGVVKVIRYRPDLRIPKDYRPSMNLSDSHWVGPATRTRNVLSQLCRGREPLALDFMPLHAPYVFIRSVLYHAESHKLISQLFDITSESKFRNGYELNSAMLMNIYSQCALNYQSIWGQQLEFAYLGVNLNINKPKYLKTAQWLTELYRQRITQKKLKFICINDVTEYEGVESIGTETAKLIYNFRQSLFPNKSSFEK